MSLGKTACKVLECAVVLLPKWEILKDAKESRSHFLQEALLSQSVFDLQCIPEGRPNSTKLLTKEPLSYQGGWTSINTESINEELKEVKPP